MVLRCVDVSDIPVNIINNLVKIVKNRIFLICACGWTTSMLNDAKCKVLKICNANLESGSERKPIVVYGSVELCDVKGDLQGLFASLTFEHDENDDVDRIKSHDLELRRMDISGVSSQLLNNLLKTVNNDIVLDAIKGFYTELLNGIKCRSLDLDDMKIQRSQEAENDTKMTIQKLYLNNIRGQIESLFDYIECCEKLFLYDSSLLKNFNMTEIIDEKVKSLVFVHKVSIIRADDSS